MNSGRLKEIITIQRSSITVDEYGANQLEWKDYITTRAAV